MEIPSDINRAPYFVVREYARAYNKAMFQGLQNPDDRARKRIQSLQDSGKFDSSVVMRKKKSGAAFADGMGSVK